MKIQNINKKFQKDKRASIFDAHHNTIHIDNVVKCISGRFQGRKGSIKFIFKNTLFLWDKDFYQTNGLFVESSRNVVILGDEHIKTNVAGAVGGVNKRFRDKLVNKDVVITKGEWKGFRGRVVNMDDKQAIIELPSKCKKIPIPRDYIEAIDANEETTTRDDFNQGGQTVYEAGKTPMQYNTPSHYTSNPYWGANPTSGFGGNTDFDQIQSPGGSRPGSEHYQTNKPMTPRSDNWSHK